MDTDEPHGNDGPSRSPLSDAGICQLVMEEELWRGTTLNLLASENRIPDSARALLASDLAGRYTLPLGEELDGEMVRNGYGGTRLADAVTGAAERAFCSVFGAGWCDIRPLSGHIAAMSALRILPRGGKFMAVPIGSGGYHGYDQRYMAGMLGLRSIPIPMDGCGVDINGFREAFSRERPGMVVLGQSYFRTPYDLRAIRETVGPETLLVYDASHVLGLMAGGEFQPDALEHCDMVFGSTHKSFPGPQGGVMLGSSPEVRDRLARDYIWTVVDNTHLHRIACTGRVCEILMDRGRRYASAIVSTARSMAAALRGEDIPLLGEDPWTCSHQIHMSLEGIRKGWGLGGQSLCDLLESNSIIADAVGRLGSSEIAQTEPAKDEIGSIASLIRRAMDGESVGREAEDLNLAMWSRGSMLEG